MNRTIRICIGVGCCALLIISWIIAVNTKSTAEKQLVLIDRAQEMISDGIYIRAAPLLEEAAGYDAVHTITAENELKRVYLALINNAEFPRKYTTLLEKQMNRPDAPPEVFIEAANHYLGISKIQEALAILKTGIDRTGDVSLLTLYENSRYVFEISRTSYENVTAIYGSTVQVKYDGKWGIASAEGIMIIACEYEQISTLSSGQAIVRNAEGVFTVDANNNRIAVPDAKISEFGNFADNRIPVLIEGSWRRATWDFEIGTTAFEAIGMYSGGYTAVKENGRWGVIDLSSNWLIPPEFDAIIMDELGRCYAQGAVFVRSGDAVHLVVNGNIIGGAYEDARPFSNEGYAAVKNNGKWGFIDTSGTVVIPFTFDDALSFGQHLAAVKIDDLWGYINRFGHIAIEPEFFDAKSFSEGSAPVLTEKGWQFITLVEFKRGGLIA